MLKQKNRTNTNTPEEVFQHMWTIGESESPRFRALLAYRLAKKMLRNYFEAVSDDKLYQMQAELDINTAYYAYYLELLHGEQEVIEDELSRRLKRR